LEFSITVKEIYEINSNGDILNNNRYSLGEKNYSLSSKNVLQKDNTTIKYLNISYPLGAATLLIRVVHYETATTIPFAGHTINISNSGVKYYTRVENWPFANIANKLVITMTMTSSNPSNNCQNQNFSMGVGEGGNLEWTKLYVGPVSLYSEFFPFAVLDDATKAIQFVSQKENGNVQILVPHFWEYAEIDPSYSVLVEPDNDQTNLCRDSSTSISIIIIIIIVVCIFGTAIVIVAVVFAVKKEKKRRTRSRLNSKLSSSNLQLPAQKKKYECNTNGRQRCPISTNKALLKIYYKFCK